MPGILDDLPPLEVTPGPARAEPLPADRPVRWGILATGRIAHSFAEALALVPDAELVAVGSRSKESAEAFTAAHGGTAYDSYAAVAADPRVDVVYVASPHTMHRELTLLALQAGKPALCEKPFTMNTRESEELVAAAADSNLFLMEAMWMRCNPLIRRLQQLHQLGRLGRIHRLRAEIGFRVDLPPSHRLLDPELGGGALLDMGIYPLTFASLFLGEPTELSTVVVMSDTGIDLDIAVTGRYAGDALATMTATMTSRSSMSASIGTDLGELGVHPSFWHPDTATWTSGGWGEVAAETIHEPRLGPGLAHEAMEVVRCLRNGETESPLVPLADTVALMRVMDAIRVEIGLTYAADQEG